MTKRKKVLVTAAPPTSNGNLHIGHLAGPFLGADVFSRFQRMLEHDVLYISYADDYQSYVERKAIEEDRTTEEVADEYTDIMENTLELAGMKPDHFYRPRSSAFHKQVMQQLFQKLWNNGQVVLRKIPTYFDVDTGDCYYEAEIKALCYRCEAECDANYCESCGFPQQPGKQKGFRHFVQQKTVGIKDEYRAFLPLSKYTSRLQEYYAERFWRPRVKELCQNILQSKIDAPISRKTSWGIPAGIAELDEHILDTWYGGAAGYISAAMDWSARKGSPDEWEVYFHKDQPAEWVAFLGFDCTFSHAVLYPALLMAHGEWRCPDAILTNEFYQLNHQKISTSRHHAIWGSDIFTEVQRDVVRYYLCLTAPEVEETNFDTSEFRHIVNREIYSKWNDWLIALCRECASYQAFDITHAEQPQNRVARDLQKAMDKAMDLSADCLDARTFSLQKAARAIKELCNAAMLHYVFMDRSDAQQHVQALAFNLRAARTLAILAQPVMPDFSRKLRLALGESLAGEEYRWADLEKAPVALYPQQTTELFFESITDKMFKNIQLQEKVGIK